LQSRFKKAEEELEQLKQQKQTIELELSAPDSYKNAVKFAETEKHYKEITAKVKLAEAHYEELFEQIMELEG